MPSIIHDFPAIKARLDEISPHILKTGAKKIPIKEEGIVMKAPAVEVKMCDGCGGRGRIGTSPRAVTCPACKGLGVVKPLMP